MIVCQGPMLPRPASFIVAAPPEGGAAPRAATRVFCIRGSDFCLARTEASVSVAWPVSASAIEASVSVARPVSLASAAVAVAPVVCAASAGCTAATGLDWIGDDAAAIVDSSLE